MARTLIGQLILRLRSEGLGEGRKVIQTMKDVENAARRLGKDGIKSWGIGFQKQIDNLRLTQQEIRKVEQSWAQLHRSMNSRNLARAMRQAEISHWKTNTISHLAQQRAAIENHFKKVENSARAHGLRMADIMRAAYVSLGFYTGAYGGGMVIREGFKEASERSRVEAENHFRGLNESERGKIESAADEISGRRRVSKTDVMEVAADAAMNFPNTDAALTTLDTQVSAFKVWANTYGEETAIGYLRAFNRAMDNINVTDPEEYKGMLDNFMKAWQVTGKDIDPSDWAMAIKYARSSGKVFGHDFLSRVLPFVMAETGGSDAGTQMRAIFDQFIVGRASKEAIDAQDQYGLRTGVTRNKKGVVQNKGELIQGDLFAENPLKWFHDVLLPAMKEKGVNTDDPLELAQEVGKLTNNRLASDSVVKALFGWDQLQRQLEERFPNAVGLDAADLMDSLSLSSAVDSLVSAFGNLSAALIPVQSVINPGLNALADALNYLAAQAKDNPLWTALGIGGTAAGVVAGGKMAAGKLADLFGLRSAAVELTVAAKMLQQAAGAQAGTDGPWGDVPGGKNKRSFREMVGRQGWILTLIDLANNPEFLPTPITDADRNEMRRMQTFAGPRGQRAEATRDGIDPNQGIRDAVMGEDTPPSREPSAIEQIFHDPSRRGDLDPSTRLRGEDVFPKKPRADLSLPSPTGTIDSMLAGMDRLKQEAENTGSQVKSSLEVQATPNINLGPLQQAVNLAQQFLSLIKQANASVSASPATASNAGRQMRRNMADYGVSP